MKSFDIVLMSKIELSIPNISVLLVLLFTKLLARNLFYKINEQVYCKTLNLHKYCKWILLCKWINLNISLMPSEVYVMCIESSVNGSRKQTKQKIQTN
jgi:thiosulfate reductase cytochrome b subunit